MSYSKNYICKFMEANLWHHKLLHFHLPFWIWKVWKGREKITKIWISQKRKEFFRWSKKHFYSFWRPMIWWKKSLIKIADTSFKTSLWKSLDIVHLCITCKEKCNVDCIDNPEFIFLIILQIEKKTFIYISHKYYNVLYCSMKINVLP